MTCCSDKKFWPVEKLVSRIDELKDINAQAKEGLELLTAENARLSERLAQYEAMKAAEIPVIPTAPIVYPGMTQAPDAEVPTGDEAI